MNEGCDSIEAIGGFPKAGGVVHFVALMLAALMFVAFLYRLKPLYIHYLAYENYGAVIYLALACLIIPAYWPYASYRLLLLLMHFFASKQVRSRAFPMLKPNDYPPVSIIVAIRNEPASLVIPLIKSLSELDYPNYEIVVADNSDLIVDNGAINNDLIEIFGYSESRGARIVRRDTGSTITGIIETPPRFLHGVRCKGDTHGGKAGNLNAAIASANERYKWFLLLDADSLITALSFRQIVSVGVQAENFYRYVGFVQGILSSSNENESSLSHAQSVIDNIYYRNYFIAKARVGLVSNWGHGVLVSRKAWSATNGFPLEISEDLAWANELHLLGEFVNYYALCHTYETKPATWKALKIQRNRWAKGTTILIRKQLYKIWRSKKLLWHEKMDLTYDMTSYIFNAAGCLLPLFFVASGVLGSGNRLFFETLVPAFYLVMAMDNMLVPLEAIRTTYRKNIRSAMQQLKAIPFISIYLGAISAQILIAVASAFMFKGACFDVTPKANEETSTNLVDALFDNKIGYLLFFVNGWVAVKAWEVNPAVAFLLFLSPIAYFLAPLLSINWTTPINLRR